MDDCSRSDGIRAGRIADCTVENVRIAANGWVGWEGDIDGEDANSGTLTFKNWLVEWTCFTPACQTAELTFEGQRPMEMRATR